MLHWPSTWIVQIAAPTFCPSISYFTFLGVKSGDTILDAYEFQTDAMNGQVLAPQTSLRMETYMDYIRQTGITVFWKEQQKNTSPINVSER